MDLYHKDVYMPSDFDKYDFLASIDHLKLSDHFVNRVWHKKLPIPTLEALANGEVFEIGKEGNIVVKVCFRLRVYHSHKDLVYVISNFGHLITGWWQSRNDKHYTLDISKYSVI